MAARRLTPYIAELFTSETLLTARDTVADLKRTIFQTPHALTVYLQLDDPHSYLLAQALLKLAIQFEPGTLVNVRIVGPPEEGSTVDQSTWAEWASRDCSVVAPVFDLEFPRDSTTPAPSDVATAQSLAAALELKISTAEGSPLLHLSNVVQIMAALRSSSPSSALTTLQETYGLDSTSTPTTETVTHLLHTNTQERSKKGHYASAMVEYGGRWFWGIDRLELLFLRLSQAGALKKDTERKINGATDADLAHALLPVSVLPFRPHLARLPQTPTPGSGSAPVVLDVFWSIRSPYSYVFLARTLPKLLRRLGTVNKCQVNLRLVPPMVTRGVPLSPVKRLYITTDASLCARRSLVPFGRISDPLAHWHRVAAVVYEARKMGMRCEWELVLSVMRGLWAQGLDAASDAALVDVAQRYGIASSDARKAIEEAERDDAAWRKDVSDNLSALTERGLWGVPSFVVRGGGGYECAMWGQDREWLAWEAVRRFSARDDVHARL
ncbi:thioredoxin-like protein [Gonapodya prolifera JEL478]|uniref:Thioredoxin-like protein n=1 Tax=Gonapodya prolifera (strain JEL478) TaxID=1344416 RepID=A0A139AMH1_GONPJ|nr:thioredoxin-like protein [Gonapodya prolifera JEL478]|eukprot:KXS17967.1 thioredoxin-like protein [Gonapodya prolifera JEL478]